MVQNSIPIVTAIQRLGREGGASRRDGESIASVVSGKLEKSGVMEAERKIVSGRKCVPMLRDTLRGQQRRGMIIMFVS